MKPEAARKAFRERALVGDARTFRDHYAFEKAEDQNVPTNGILLAEPGKWIVDKPGTIEAKLRLREEGERPATWVLLWELTSKWAELTLEELTERNLALLESRTPPTDEDLLGDEANLGLGSIWFGDEVVIPVPVSRIELLPKAFDAMAEFYRARDAKMVWKRRISAAIVALGGPGTTDEEIAGSTDAEYERYETLLKSVPGMDLDSYDGESPASGPKAARRPQAWGPKWLDWVNPIGRALHEHYDVSLPNKTPNAEFERHEVLLKAAGVDLLQYDMTAEERNAVNPQVQSVTVIQPDGGSATQTFDPPTDLATSQKAARGLKARLQSWFGGKSS